MRTARRSRRCGGRDATGGRARPARRWTGAHWWTQRQSRAPCSAPAHPPRARTPAAAARRAPP
uniref:Uncharacterized protein n=1 Tax=Arundo donax TaxID=35708 RepID=A0A0A9A1I3_ARUDO